MDPKNKAFPVPSNNLSYKAVTIPGPTTAVKLSLGGFIGCDIGYNFKFTGSIDDVRIYDRALSDQDSLQLYNLDY